MKTQVGTMELRAKLVKDGQRGLHMTNGIDVLHARLTHAGRYASPGGYITKWTVTDDNGNEIAVFPDTPKLTVMEYIDRMLSCPRTAPLTPDEAHAMQERDGKVHGIVAVTLERLIMGDMTDLMDEFAKRLVGDMTLYEAEYWPVGTDVKSSLVHVRVSGKIKD